MKVSHLLPAATFCVGLAQALVFPIPNTPYKVQWTSTELIDHAHPDPFNASHPRRIMISRFTPIPNRDCLRTCRVPYMNTFMSALEDSIIDGFLGDDIGWPHGVFSTFELEVCCQTRKNFRHQKYPLVFFDTGLNTTRLLYSASAQNFASMGYEVIVMDHPYDTDAVQFPDGSVIYGNRVPRDPSRTEALAFALDVRAKDASFVMDYLGVSKKGKGLGSVGWVGDSFGGPAAATAMINDARIGAGVNVDGMMFGPALEEGVDRPFLIFGTPGRNSTSVEDWKRFREATETNHPGTWFEEINLAGSVHGILIDFGLVVDVAGLRDNDKLVGNLVGKITGVRTMEILREYLSNFVDFALREKGEGLLAGPSEKYPEILFV